MTYLRTQEPFMGDLPDVTPGDRVTCRTAFDEWVPMVAMSGPRYDHEHASGRTVWMSVAVALVADWEIAEADAAWANWPAQDVRLEDGAR